MSWKQSLKKMNPKKPTPRHIIIKMLDMENLEICQRKTSTCIQRTRKVVKLISQQKLYRPEGTGMIYSKH